MIRLLVSDIDGTMVRHDKSLPDANVAAVKRAVSAGIAVGLISARPPSGMMWIAEALGLSGPHGAFNGATLFTSDGTILATDHLPRDAAAEALALIDAPGVSPWLFADGQWHARDLVTPHIGREIQSAGVEPVVDGDWTKLLDRTDKVVAVCDNPDQLAALEARTKAALDGRATVARSQTYYLDILSLGGNKGAGVRALAARAGVALAQVAVLGDQNNDLAMFAIAGLSVAMAQAPDNVRAAASHVALATNDKAGVAEAIDRFVLPAC